MALAFRLQPQLVLGKFLMQGCCWLGLHHCQSWGFSWPNFRRAQEFGPRRRHRWRRPRWLPRSEL